MTVVAFTGHRPKDLGGYGDLKAFDARLVKFAEGVLIRLPLLTEVISGMAEGWDMAVAEAAANLGVPFRAAIPFEGQERRWSGYSQMRYRRLRLLAHDEVVLKPFADRAFYRDRDEWMVDNASALCALWSGKTFGGTFNTVEYARRWCVPTLNVWPSWVAFN